MVLRGGALSTDEFRRQWPNAKTRDFWAGTFVGAGSGPRQEAPQGPAEARVQYMTNGFEAHTRSS